MDLLQTIINYYHGEARHGLWGAVIGAILLIGGLILLKWASPLSLFKGLSLPMLLFGLMLGIGGGADNIYTNKISSEKIAMYQNNTTTFLKDEKIKTEKTHQGWRGVRIFWGILGFGGLLLSLFIRKPFWLGAGLGTIALAIIISLFELYSMRFNERYYKAIQSAATSDESGNTDKRNAVADKPLALQPIPAGAFTDKRKQLKFKSGVLQDTVASFDSLKSLSAIDLYTKSNAANDHKPDSTHSLYVSVKAALADDQESNQERFRPVKARHCWLGKRILKKDPGDFQKNKS